MRIFVQGVDSYVGSALVQALRKSASDAWHRIFGSLTPPAQISASALAAAVSGGGGSPSAVGASAYSQTTVVKKTTTLAQNAGAKADGGSVSVRFKTKIAKEFAQKENGNSGIVPVQVKRSVNFELDDEKVMKKYDETIMSCKFVVFHLDWASDHDDPGNVNFKELEYALNLMKNSAGEGDPITFILVSSALVWGSGKIEDPSDFAKREPNTDKLKKWKQLEDEVLALNDIEGGRVHSHIVAPGALYGNGDYGMFGELFKHAWAGLSTGADPENVEIPTCHVADCAGLVKYMAHFMDIGPGQHVYAVASVPETLSLPRICQEVEKEMLPPGTVQHGSVPVDWGSSLVVPTSELMLGDEYDEHVGWVQKEGLSTTANVRKVAEEFSTRRNLRGMRVCLLLGDSAPTSDELAAMSSINRKNALQDERTKASQIEDLKDYLAESFHIDTIGNLKEAEDKNACRLRGYVHQCDLKTLTVDKCKELFQGSYDETIPAEEEGEDDQVITHHFTKKDIPKHIVAINVNESEDGDSSALAFFRETGVEIFIIIAPSYLRLPSASVNTAKESVQIYLERDGRPTNYAMPTEAEVMEAVNNRHEEERRLAAEANTHVSADDLEETRRKESKNDKTRFELLSSLLEEERTFANSISTKDFLMTKLVPVVVGGLAEVAKLKSKNPIDHFANYLDNYCEEVEAAAVAAAAVKAGKSKK